MTLIVATIPEDGAELPGWLERQLVGLDLRRLVAELSAVHRPSSREQAGVAEVLKGQLERVYSKGLESVPRAQLRYLLTHPALLLQLQELVLENGGPYWDALSAENAAISTRIERGRQRLVSKLQLGPAPADQALRQPWYRPAWFATLAVAAALLVAVAGWEMLRPARVTPSVSWGWGKPGALAKDVSREEYFNALANSADEWFKKEPQTAEELATRLAQLRQGCSKLLLTDHSPPLTDDDQKWLKDRCKKWATNFDARLADVEAGKDVEAVRKEADAAVTQLVKALRERGQAG